MGPADREAVESLVDMMDVGAADTMAAAAAAGVADG